METPRNRGEIGALLTDCKAWLYESSEDPDKKVCDGSQCCDEGALAECQEKLLPLGQFLFYLDRYGSCGHPEFFGAEDPFRYLESDRLQDPAPVPEGMVQSASGDKGFRFGKPRPEVGCVAVRKNGTVGSFLHRNMDRGIAPADSFDDHGAHRILLSVCSHTRTCTRREAQARADEDEVQRENAEHLGGVIVSLFHGHFYFSGSTNACVTQSQNPSIPSVSLLQGTQSRRSASPSEIRK